MHEQELNQLLRGIFLSDVQFEKCRERCWRVKDQTTCGGKIGRKKGAIILKAGIVCSTLLRLIWLSDHNILLLIIILKHYILIAYSKRRRILINLFKAPVRTIHPSRGFVFFTSWQNQTCWKAGTDRHKFQYKWQFQQISFTAWPFFLPSCYLPFL